MWFECLNAWMARNVRWLFAVALAAVFLAHLSTVLFYPTPWYDEVQLIENGRCAVFERDTAWSLILHKEASDVWRPEILPTYLSGTVAEGVDRITGVWWGHRAYSLAGLMAVTGLCLLWLLGKGFALPVACGVALLFGTDVHLTKSAHFYRPDVWVLAFSFATALCVNWMGRRPSRLTNIAFVGLGFAMAAQILFWFSAVFGLTLVAAELLVLAQCQAWPWRDVAGRFAALAAGGVLGFAVLLVVPFAHELPTFALFFLKHPDMQALHATLQASDNACGVADVALKHVLDLAHLLVRSPFIWLLASVGAVASFGRSRIYGGFFFGYLLFLLAMRAYCFRIVYFLPLAAYFAAAAWSDGRRRTLGRPLAGAMLSLFIGAGLSCGVGVNGVGLNLIAASGPREGSRVALARELEAVVGRGPRKVYIFSWQPYFIGRELGWHLIAFLPDGGKFVFDPKGAQVLASVDYLLEQEFGAGTVEDNGRAPLTGQERAMLRAAGFEPVGRVGVDAAAHAQAQAETLGARLRTFIWASEYPSYTVWKNRQKASLR